MDTRGGDDFSDGLGKGRRNADKRLSTSTPLAEIASKGMPTTIQREVIKFYNQLRISAVVNCQR